MSDQAQGAIAIVGVGGILPDAPDAPTFWQNVQQGRYSITDVSPNRWDPADYYDPDPTVPDKTYSKIGGWVRAYEFDPIQWHIPIPPRVLGVMDDAQKWAIAVCRAALLDYGYPQRPLDTSRTAVILGNAMAGENHYLTALRIYLPEYEHALEAVPKFSDLPPGARQALLEGMRGEIRRRIADITEDTMPGELANIIAGRVANVFNLGGPNFVTDAACASSFAALHAAVEGLIGLHFDAVLTGGIDRNMGAPSFVKFCKVGALSPDGSRPYAEGANGFVMGEGAVAFLLKRLADAEHDGDNIYAVVRGIGGSSDGKGKGITAPNPVGQQRAVERAWENAGLSPATATYIEGHGTSTRVGDVVEVESIARAFSACDLPTGSIALSSVKSNIGHIKGAAGAAGLLKACYALRDKVLPPTVNFQRPNPNIDFDRLPFYVHTELRPWDQPACGVRRAGVSSFGFGGTNFHVVVEEHIPGMLTTDHAIFQVKAGKMEGWKGGSRGNRGALVVGAPDIISLQVCLEAALADVQAGNLPPPQAPSAADLVAAERIAIDFGSAEELLKRGEKAVQALQAGDASVWKPLASQGIFRANGEPGKVAFLFPGQGSQYVNMLRELRDVDPVVAETFREADQVMQPLLGRPLTDYILVDAQDEDALKAAEARLRDTTITQPAVLTADVALTRVLAGYGVVPDLVIGHSLGEYAALVAAGVLSFAEALQIVSARGREMSKVSVEDNGCMAAISAPLMDVERILAGVEGYAVLANINSRNQAVIGGATRAVDDAIALFTTAGYQAVKIPVSHAFHTHIVAPASEPLKQVIARMNVQPPRLPVVANVTGELYPSQRDEIIDLLGRQVASPVQFVKGVETLYRQGARILVEVGPKRVLKGLVEDILGDREDVTILFTNHPRKGALPSLNEALCGLYAAGVGASPATQPPHTHGVLEAIKVATPVDVQPPHTHGVLEATKVATTVDVQPPHTHGVLSDDDRYLALGHLFADFLEQGRRIYEGTWASASGQKPSEQVSSPDVSAPRLGGQLPLTGSVVISGAALGLPGQEGRVFDDRNVDRILRGEQFIELIPYRFRTRMAEKRITRLVKREAGATFEVIVDPEETIKLAGRRGQFDLAAEFGVPASRVEALDISSQLAIAAGIEALRDAGIPLAMRYRVTSKDTYLPDRWMLPEALADETGVVFASAFPGLDRVVDEVTRFNEHKALNEQLRTLTRLRSLASSGPVPPSARLGSPDPSLEAEIERRIADVQDRLASLDYGLDRQFIFRILAMGHSQFAEYIGARGPNTHVNAACATTTHAIAVAEDWIRSGRCRRVIVIAGDDVTGENLMEWIGAGLLATGATTTEERLDRAALPFDRRRNGMIIGMGAAAIVLEAEDAVRERGMRGICEVLASQIANSAFHGTRLDVEHICEVMDRVVGQAEERFGIDRCQIAAQTVFVSHETYTPARGGSAATEIHALRRTFGDRAREVVIANTKGYTGHAMGVGIEDVLAVKALERGIVPPVANIHDDFQPDPELGDLNLSRGGRYPVQYALRLGAGFGSQIAIALLRRIPGPVERVDRQEAYDRWLADMAGYDRAELEIENRTLRIRDAGPPIHQPARSAWQHGRGPDAWAAAPSGATASASLAPATQASASQSPVPQTSMPQVSVPPSLAGAMHLPSNQRACPERGQMSVVEGLPCVAPEAERRAAYGGEGRDPVTDRILALVSEKTGYPPDMLDLDLDLEADLGIDTVKQAEVLASIREAYGIPRREDLKLRDYNTLAKVIAFVHDAAMPGIDTAGSQPGSSTLPPSITPAGPQGRDPVPCRVPVPVLRPDLELGKPTGVTFDAGSRVVIVSDGGKAGKYLGYRLRARKVKALILQDATPEMAASQIGAWLSEGPIAGVYFLPALDVEPPLSEMDLARWHAEQDRRVKTLYACMRALPDVAFLICGTRLGGLHGYGPEGATAPLGGAVTGFAKAYAMECPSALVKAVDFALGIDDREIAERLFEEALRDPGAVEIGYRGGQRFGVGLVNRPDEPWPVDGHAPPVVLGRETVFVITGGAGGITASVVADLARVSAGTFYLAGRTPLPDPVDKVEGMGSMDLDLARLGRSRLQRDRLKELKRDIAERIKRSGTRPTPAMVEREIAALERIAAIRDVIREVGQAGGTAHYRACNVTDPQAVAALVGEVKQKHGRIDVLIHAAGIERSHLLADKEPDEFNQVFGVKADGLFNLLKTTHELGCPLGACVVFSSVAGRFGNAGQTDYSAANDLMCKVVSSLGREAEAAPMARAIHPGLKAIAIDWSAWSGAGMATRQSIPEMMRRAGIDMLDPAEAAPVVRREIIAAGRRMRASAGGSAEVVVARSLGVLLSPRGAGDACIDGGLDLERANARIVAQDRAFPCACALAGRVTGLDTYRGFVLEVELDPQAEPFLRDHVMDGTPLLPGVMGVEGFAQVAMRIASLVGRTGERLHVTTIEDVRFEAPLKFYHNEPRTLTWRALLVPASRSLWSLPAGHACSATEKGGPEPLVAYVTLESARPLKAGQDHRMDSICQHTRHFSGRVHLEPVDTGMAGTLPAVHSLLAPAWNGAGTVEPEAIYRVYFHGPAFQVLEGVQSDAGQVIGKLRPDLPPIAGRAEQTLLSPRLIELCLQTAGIWEIGKTGVLALPAAIERIVVHDRMRASALCDPAGEGGSLSSIGCAHPHGASVYAVIEPKVGEGQDVAFDAQVVDEHGNVYVELHGYRTARLPGLISNELVAPLQAAVAGA